MPILHTLINMLHVLKNELYPLIIVALYWILTQMMSSTIGNKFAVRYFEATYNLFNKNTFIRLIFLTRVVA